MKREQKRGKLGILGQKRKAKAALKLEALYYIYKKEGNRGTKAKQKARKIEATEQKTDNVTSLRRQIIPAGQPLPPQPSANEISPEALARVNEIEKRAKKLSLLELTEKTCKWPVGDPATEDFWFCGLATQSGKPYCEAHVGVAFQPMNSRRDRRR